MLRIKSEILRRRQRRHMAAQTHNERRRHIADLFLLLILLILTNVGAMMYFEGLAFDDALWLSFTTVTTVGYGDFVAQTGFGRLTTVLLLYVIGIFVLAQIAGEWIDYRFDRRDRMRLGYWRWKMKDHILILNTPDQNGERYLRLLVQQIRDTPLLADHPIQVFSPHFTEGLPTDISTLSVVLRSGKPEGDDSLVDVDVDRAAFIVLLAVDTHDERSDSINLDMLDQLREHDVPGYVIVECVLESNRERFKRMGANAVIRPIRAYPELLVRTMAAPGTEAILEDLFVYAGNHVRRYDVSFEHSHWGELAGAILKKGLGTPLGYLDDDNNIITNPTPDTVINGKAIYVMVSQNAEYLPKEVTACVAAAGA